MVHRFADRAHAGRELARRLGAFAGRPDVRVLALPRGGVPVGYEVARALGVPLDVFVVRKLGVPGHEELAMGAIASGGTRVLDRSVTEVLGIGDDEIEQVTAREAAEVARRDALYRAGRPPVDVRGKTVILVDDGLATGSTMSAAVEAVRGLQPAVVIVAVPVSSDQAAEMIGAIADELIALLVPRTFFAVGAWYDDFGQTSDEEVRELLRRAAYEAAPEAHP